MYHEFNACISNFSNESEPCDYWYDCAILEAITILKNFNAHDWSLLLKELKFKSVFWQQRLVECLGDLHNPYELEVIFELISTEDNKLFINCIDSLRYLSLSKIDDFKKEKLLSKIKKILENPSSPIKCVLEDFIQKNQ